MTIRILPVTEYDFERIYELEQRIFPEPYSLELLLHDFVNNPFSRYFKLIEDHETIGYAGVWVLFEDAQIVTIGIDPDFQGKGYGRRLLHYLMDYLQEEGCERVTLEVRVSNEKALTLYRSFGFEPVAIRKHYYENGEDAYLMVYDFPKVDEIE